METLAGILYLAAMFSPLFALVAALAIYLKYQNTSVGSRRSVVLFSLGVLFVGLVAGWVGMLAGIQVFCSLYSGAQCGFGGVFVTGPMSFTLAVAAYLYFWAKHGKAP